MNADERRRSATTDGIRSDSGTVKVRQVSVEAFDGPGKGAKALLAVEPLVIGSSSGAGLTISDRSVSRRHASLQLIPGAVEVKDLGSRNGTHYLGAKIKEARVPIGGSIRIGRTKIRFASPSDALPMSD